jgi:hypothetical protein
MPAEERVVHLKERDKVPSETACGKPMYTLGPQHSAVEHEEGSKITCQDCKDRYIR